MMESIRLYISNRQRMGRCQTILAFLAICGVVICVLTLVLYYSQRSSKSKIVTIPPELKQEKNKRTKDYCQQQITNLKKVTYFAKMGLASIATRVEDFTVTKNAYWLKGNPWKDSRTLKDVQIAACMNKVPLVVIKMRPDTKDYQINDQLRKYEYYKEKINVSSWKMYDRKLNKIIKVLEDMPCLVVMEPDLLLFGIDIRNSQNRWTNLGFIEEFLKRVQTTVKRLKRGWVYLDAGHPYFYGESAEHIKIMSLMLLRVPGLRGFIINTEHFGNQTYTEWVSRRLHCRTGLNYIMDTSRNRGSFSALPFPLIDNCIYDPPAVLKGQEPGWSWGYRKKQGSNKEDLRTKSEATVELIRITKSLGVCMQQISTKIAQDATVWIKTPGLADGRLYPRDSFHLCLLGHTIDCMGMCPLLRHHGFVPGDECKCL